jgi:hypothetical protein
MDVKWSEEDNQKMNKERNSLEALASKEFEKHSKSLSVDKEHAWEVLKPLLDIISELEYDKISFEVTPVDSFYFTLVFERNNHKVINQIDYPINNTGWVIVSVVNNDELLMVDWCSFEQAIEAAKKIPEIIDCDN